MEQGYNVIGADITIGDPIRNLGCQAEQLDVASPDSIQAFKQKLGDQPVDLLLNIAGICCIIMSYLNTRMHDLTTRRSHGSSWEGFTGNR